MIEPHNPRSNPPSSPPPAPDGLTPAPRPSGPNPTGDPTNPPGDFTCLFCGEVMRGGHCKLTCPNCGYREDCSDLFRA